MKDEWFSDHLDLVKWAILYRLAANHGLKHVAHVAFFSPSEPPDIRFGDHDHRVDDLVWSYFRNWKRMERLALGDLHVRIFDRAWPGAGRADYVESAICWLKQQEPPKLVLLDGEGLGHTPRSTSTISTTLSKRIDMVDAVILVSHACFLE